MCTSQNESNQLLDDNSSDSLVHILELANLNSLGEDQDVDILDIDLMFMKIGANSFDQFKLIKLTDEQIALLLNYFLKKI